MKVGVVTFHSAVNFGATLQTWALQEALKSYNIEPCVINYHPAIIDNLYDPIKVDGGVKRLAKIAKLKLNKSRSLYRWNKYNNFIRENLTLLGDYKTYEDLEKADFDLDAFIVGSDQVWNGQHTNGYDPAYFLEFASEDKIKMSYAASVARDYIPSAYHKDIKRALKTFSSISVREVEGKGPIEELTDKKVHVVSDPTFLIPKERYNKIKKDPGMKEKYILVYMMERNKEVITFANTISRALGLPIVQRRPTKIFANETTDCYTSDPGEFLGLIENAELVITNSFHGTVFAAIYEKPFLSLLHSETGSRTINLLKSLELEDHLLYSLKDFKDFGQFQIKNPKKLRENILQIRRDSLEFLEDSLGLNTDELVECPTNIKKKKCYGCYACKEVCPTKAITMVEDEKGFKYPVADEKCINCGACSRVCIRKEDGHQVKHAKGYPIVLAAMNNDEEKRMKSSSGATFPELVKYTIEEKGGVVVGVKYSKDMEAVSDIVETVKDAEAFYGSKYVKSNFDGIFPRVKKYLNEGRYVLYSGLPCECAALRSYLRKDYDNLLIAEILCHASPSPKVFRKYVDYLGEKFNSKVTNIKFRDKSDGWLMHKCNMVISFEDREDLKVNYRRNNYARAFANDFIARESCAYCEYTGRKRAGDITIGDFWGIRDTLPHMFDDKGTTMIMVNNQKALNAWNEISNNFTYENSTVRDAFRKNHKKPIKMKVERNLIFDRLDKTNINDLLEEYNDLKKKK